MVCPVFSSKDPALLPKVNGGPLIVSLLLHRRLNREKKIELKVTNVCFQGAVFGKARDNKTNETVAT